jgi:hypothetical protein
MEIVKSIIGASDPIKAATEVLQSLPEGVTVIIVTDAPKLMARAGKIYRNAPDYPAWRALIDEEFKRTVSYHFNTVPVSHEGVPAE